MARKAMSHDPDLRASNTLPAASKGTSSTGRPRRLASSRARSTVMPRGSPPAGSFCARTMLLRLIAARSVPVGANSLSGGGEGGSGGGLGGEGRGGGGRGGGGRGGWGLVDGLTQIASAV